jgi:hypothetical protein
VKEKDQAEREGNHGALEASGARRPPQRERQGPAEREPAAACARVHGAVTAPAPAAAWKS